jgi:hypothetical protein
MHCTSCIVDYLLPCSFLYAALYFESVFLPLIPYTIDLLNLLCPSLPFQECTKQYHINGLPSPGFSKQPTNFLALHATSH